MTDDAKGFVLANLFEDPVNNLWVGLHSPGRLFIS
jgi:hypothetical protein